jgi:hypothetical protein
VDLTAGQTVSGMNFGNFELGTITGVLFHDRDNDGSLDTGEETLAGRTVFLDKNMDGVFDEGEDTAITSAEGIYSFTGIRYVSGGSIGQVVPEGWERTTAPMPFDVTSGFSATIHVGNIELGSISGIKFNDLDGDGNQDEEEPGIAGWTIFLDRNANGSLDDTEVFTITGADGSYRFDNLLPGPNITYIVAELEQAGWRQTSPLGTVPAGVTAISTSGSQAWIESLGCG